MPGDTPQRPRRGRAHAELMNRRGMTVVHDQVLNGPGWFIRDQVVSDVGIDAQVEVVDDGDPTGRLLSLQVKSGPSWFRRPTKGGWYLPVKDRHRDYWLRHTLPVVVVLVDVEADRAYWQLVDASTVERSGKGHRLFVPSTNLVSEAAEQWAYLAGEMTASAPGRWPEVLTHLPPGATRAVRRLHAAGAETSAAVLACHLADGRQDPADTVQTLLRADPVWISDHGSRGWTALSAYAIEHDHLALSGEALLRAVAGGTTHREPAADIADLLALAALRLSVDDRSRAQEAVEEAFHRDPASPRAALVRSLLTQDLASAAPFSLPGDLDLTSARAAADTVIQALLADDAHRRWETDREVRLRTQLWKTNEQDGTASKHLAVALMRRAGTRNSQQDDDQRARRLFESALAERHRWDGPTLDVLRPLLGLLLSQGDARAVLRLALPLPAGTATPAESRRQEVVRLAVQAALQLRDEPLARQLAEGLDGSGPSLLLRAEVTGERLDPASEEQALRGALHESLESDAAEALGLVLALAHRGVDASAELDDLVARSVVSARHREFAAALALTRTDLDAGLPRLRQLARVDALVAETLVDVLAGADRAEEALAVCEQAQTRFPHGPFTAQRAAVLGDAGRTAEAVEAARTALAEGVVTGIPAARLHHLLAQDAIDGRRWGEAERQLARAVQQQSPPPAGWVWNLVVAVLHQHQPRRAVELLRRYRPAVRDVEDARLWMSAWQHLPLDADAAVEALDLADRFFSDAELSASLLSTVVLVTRTSTETDVDFGDDTPSEGGQTEDADPRHVVPGELHRRAFAAMQAHSAQHGDASPFRWRSGSTEELTEQARAMVRERYESTVEQARIAADAVQRVQRGEVPACLLSAAVGHGYVEGLVQRDAGLFVAGSPVDHEHEAEVAAASEAAQVPVVVDASVLVLLAGLPHGQDLLARFPRVVTSTAVVADSVRAAGKLLHSLGTSLTLSWDPELQRPRALPDPPGRRARAAARAQVVAECAQGLPAEEVPLQSLRDALVGDLDDDESLGAPSDAQSEQADLQRDAPWLSALALARDRGWSLWCDDLALRRMARAHGVPTFGTPALLQAQVTAELQRAEQVDEPASSQRLGAALEAYARDVRAMVADGVVDVPAGPDLLLEIAEGEGWTTGAASAVLACPLWWSDAEPALRDLRAVFVRLAEEPAADLLAWAHTAMVGAARAYRGAPQGAATVIAAVCVLAEGCRMPDAVDDRGDSEDAVEAAQLANVAREVAEEHGLPDPAEVRDAAVHLMTGALD